MPKNVMRVENMAKHLTPDERAARRKAEQALERKTVRLIMPKALKGNLQAEAYWKVTLRRMRGISLLDDLDSEMLGVYCQTLARRDLLNVGYENAVMLAMEADDAIEQATLMAKAADMLPRIEASERIILSYAEKLGLTPSGRVRLAKKRAEEKSVDPNADLFGEGE